MDGSRDTANTPLGGVVPGATDPPPSEALEQVASKVVRWYLLVAAAWVLVTDGLTWLLTDVGAGTLAIDVAKGLGFVAVSTALIWALLRRVTDRYDRDVAQRVRAQRDFYSSVLATTPDPIVIGDADGRIVYVNEAFTAVLGFAPEDVLGRQGRELVRAEDRIAAVAYREGLDGPMAAGERSFLLRHADGSFRTMAARGAAIQLAGGEHGFVVNVRDITDLTWGEQRLRAALAEDVAGLPNLRAFVAEMDLIDQLRPAGVVATVVLTDIDRFRDVNVLHGREGGDTVLAEVARRLVGAVPEALGVWRHGADEFLLVVVDAAERSVPPLQLAERVRAVTATPIAVEEGDARVAIELSVGVAQVDLDQRDHGESLGTALLRVAEAALSEAKGHPDRYVVTLGAGPSEERARLKAELHEAIALGQLVVHYQPKVRLADGRPAGAEALVRWAHPTRGLLGPNLFLPAISEMNLGAALFGQVLDDALGQLRRWIEVPGCDPAFAVCVNVTADDLRRTRFVADVLAALEAADVAPERLCLELTEQTMLADVLDARTVVEELRRHGVQVAIDDFGTGYSSLEHIRLLEVDELKIDRSFVQRLGASARDEAIVDSVVAVSDRIGVRLVAEGIETPGQLAYLRERGCALGQGYLFSRPVPPDRIDPCRTDPVS